MCVFPTFGRISKEKSLRLCNIPMCGFCRNKFLNQTRPMSIFGSKHEHKSAFSKKHGDIVVEKVKNCFEYGFGIRISKTNTDPLLLKNTCFVTF